MERRRFIRKELKENQENEIFCKADFAVEKNLFEFFIGIIAKSNQLLNMLQTHKFEDEQDKVKKMNKEERQNYKQKEPSSD